MPPIDELTRIEPVLLARLDRMGIFTTGLLLEVSETPTRRQTLADQMATDTTDVLTWRDEALMLNLASFGPDEHQLMIQAGIEGLKGILDLDQRCPPGALGAFPRHLAREAADDPIARDSLEDRPFEPVPSPSPDASADGGSDDGADRENQQQRQEVFGGNPIGEKRGERPHQIGDSLHPLEQQQDSQIHRNDNKQTSNQRF